MKRDPGTYRGVIVEHSVSKTKKGNPQLLIRIQPQEVYDFEDQEWYGVDQTNLLPDFGYLVLCSPTAEMFHLADVREALGWSGTTFKSLAEFDTKDMKVQYRMAENDYEGKVTVQMQGIRPYDAAPVGTLRAATDDDLKQMDADFGGFLKNSAAKTKTTAPKTAPKPPKPPKAPATPKAEAPAEVAETTPSTAPKPPKPKGLPSSPPGTPPAVPEVKEPSPIEMKIDGKILDDLPAVTTKDECWAVVTEQATTYEADNDNVFQWWEDYVKMYPNQWDTVKTEVVREILKESGIPF